MSDEPRVKALLIGVSGYKGGFRPLPSCEENVGTLAAALREHGDGSDNFEVSDHVIKEGQPWNSGDLLVEVDDALADCDHLLFYFTGHGAMSEFGLQLVMPDKEHSYDLGMYFDTLLHRFNSADVREITVILDCCYSGAAGDHVFKDAERALRFTALREGVTVLSSSGRDFESWVTDDDSPSVFTQSVLDCLLGSTEDVLNIVDVYNWTRRNVDTQIPVLRTFGSRFSPLRAVNEEKNMRYLDTVG